MHFCAFRADVQTCYTRSDLEGSGYRYVEHGLIWKGGDTGMLTEQGMIWKGRDTGILQREWFGGSRYRHAD